MFFNWVQTRYKKLQLFPKPKIRVLLILPARPGFRKFEERLGRGTAGEENDTQDKNCCELCNVAALDVQG